MFNQNYTDAYFPSQGEGVGDFLKAMQAGSISGLQTANIPGTYEGLKPESVEETIKNLDFTDDDVKFWNAIPKLPAYNTVEEYVLRQSYGNDNGGFYSEGEPAQYVDTVYLRTNAIVKYLQVGGSVTLQAQMTVGYVNALVEEVKAKTYWCIRKACQTVTRADNKIVPEEYNGLYAQHGYIGDGSEFSSMDAYMDSNRVVDMRGRVITQQDIERAALVVNNNFGSPNAFWAPTTVLSDYMIDQYPTQRYGMGNGALTNMGVNVGTVYTASGTISLNGDKFFGRGPSKVLSDLATSPKAPGSPVVAAISTVADPNSKFVAGEAWSGALGTVFYAVSAQNKYGESAPVVFNNTTKTTLTAAFSVQMVFTAATSGEATTGYVIYRSMVTTAANATTNRVIFYPIFRVSATELAAGYDGAPAGAVRDTNRFLPNSEEGFVTQMRKDILSYKQLAPISKIDLAIMGPSKQFMMYLFGTPMLYQKSKFVKFINIGRKV